MGRDLYQYFGGLTAQGVLDLAAELKARKEVIDGTSDDAFVESFKVIMAGMPASEKAEFSVLVGEVTSHYNTHPKKRNGRDAKAIFDGMSADDIRALRSTLNEK